MSNSDLLYDWCLHTTRLHLLLQEDLLLGLRDDVLSTVGSANHLQDLTWEETRGGLVSLETFGGETHAALSEMHTLASDELWV